jgi:hypothetical protein
VLAAGGFTVALLARNPKLATGAAIVGAVGTAGALGLLGAGTMAAIYGLPIR